MSFLKFYHIRFDETMKPTTNPTISDSLDAMRNNLGGERRTVKGATTASEAGIFEESYYT